ncbi:MAG: threonine--tRNA ligase [Deltaproteobacteria bacterium]|nr:threonine--tRNA ligase [Deltaproteobacteria bacterium]MBW2691561.1 threonine--tRNA ligase [Deltaproteobacteria bacterium]
MSELQIRLPDGNTLAVPKGSTVLDVARIIGRGLAKAAFAGRIDGRLVDLRTPLEADAAIEIVTKRDPEAGEVIRHSAEHVMADAVKRLFPNAQVDVGRTDHSEKFQYDFLVETPFTPEDLEEIEKEMWKILAEKSEFVREVMSREEAEAFFAARGEELKVSRLADIPDDQPITIFRHGEFADLCRGPHVQRADQIGAFNIIDSAGAYWRGDESQAKLQRIYGTAFATEKELQAHVAQLEEAKRRDHRRVGAALQLYFTDSIAPGSPFYLPKGMILYNGLVDFVRSLYPKYGFTEVMTPQLFRTEIFKTSGHYDLFREDMFLLEGDEDEELGVKPMNCPGHCHLFSTQKHSYRELPIRYAEFSRLHRNERSGTLTGLSRVRSMAQDDAHIFCEPDQVEAELDSFFELTKEIYRALGLEDPEIAVSTRPEEFSGDTTDWDVAGQQLADAVKRAGYECSIKPGEAAFYGPKIECDFRDVMGRAWTLATLQVDVSMPGRFGLRYVGRDDKLHQPAMLHRAILGSLERFIALYTEMTGGDFPFWLAPVQVALLPIADRHQAYAGRAQAALEGAGIRVFLDTRNEKLGYKIREAEIQKVPLMLVVGDQEEADGTVTPRRRRGSKQSNEAVALDKLVDELAADVRERRVSRPEE